MGNAIEKQPASSRFGRLNLTSVSAISVLPSRRPEGQTEKTPAFRRKEKREAAPRTSISILESAFRRDVNIVYRDESNDDKNDNE